MESKESFVTEGHIQSIKQRFISIWLGKNSIWDLNPILTINPDSAECPYIIKIGNNSGFTVSIHCSKSIVNKSWSVSPIHTTPATHFTLELVALK